MCRCIPPIVLERHQLRALLRGAPIRVRGMIIQIAADITPDELINEAIDAESLSREME